MKNGFTLLEMLVAIAVLTSAVSGPILLASQAIKAAELTKNNLLASNLAQEGIELIRNYRANNAYGGTTNFWLNDLVPPGPSENCETAKGCYIDYLSLNPQSCSGSGCPLLLYDNVYNSYAYGCASGDCSPSIFRRVIHVITGPASEQIQATVNSAMEWNDRFGSHKFETEETILNWLQYQ